MLGDMIHFDPTYCQKRWIAYFDLLGTKELINTRHLIEVFTVYANAIEQVSQIRHSRNIIRHTWFSDTFLMFSNTNSISDFAYIDHTARIFADGLICQEIPLRGALSCGSFYGDFNDNIFFGEALIEAHRYGEMQNWIGFILCPSTVSQLSTLGSPATELRNYAFTNIPLNSKAGDNIESHLPACIIGDWFQINGRNPCIKALSKMKSDIADEYIRQKYDNTIHFLETHRRISKDDQDKL